jgi:hypothetical protein
MSDTVKIRRPRFDRRRAAGSGRVEHDDRGDAVWVRTRAVDPPELAVDPELSLVEDPASAAERADDSSGGHPRGNHTSRKSTGGV